MTSDAVKFPRFACPFVFHSSGLKKGRQDPTQNQHGAFVIGGGEPVLHPVAHCIFVNTEQLGDLFNRIAAVNFDKTGVGVTFFHVSPR